MISHRMRRRESRPGRAGRAQKARKRAGKPTVTSARTVLWRGDTGIAKPNAATPKITIDMYMARERKRCRLSCMPLMMRWPSTTARGSAENESSRRIMSAMRGGLAAALHRDAEVRLLEDITSLTPSPIIATQ